MMSLVTLSREGESSLSLHEHTLKKGHVRAQGESSYLQAMPTAGLWSGVRLSLSQPQYLVCKWPSDCTTCKVPALGPVATDWQTAPADSAMVGVWWTQPQLLPHLLLTDPLLPAKNIAQHRGRLLPTNKSNSGTIPELSEKSGSNKVAMKSKHQLSNAFQTFVI